MTNAHNCLLLSFEIYKLTYHIFQVVTLDFGKKNLNPLANLCFYTKHNVNLAQHVNPEEVRSTHRHLGGGE